MAAPTSTITREPHYSVRVTGTDVDAGDNDYVLDYNQAALSKGFSIITGTLTAMTVTVLGQNGTNTVDITGSLWSGVSALASDTEYAAAFSVPFQKIIVRAARTNATNAIDLEIFAPRR